jgi:hypothetical protein
MDGNQAGQAIRCLHSSKSFCCHLFCLLSFTGCKKGYKTISEKKCSKTWASITLDQPLAFPLFEIDVTCFFYCHSLDIRRRIKRFTKIQNGWICYKSAHLISPLHFHNVTFHWSYFLQHVSVAFAIIFDLHCFLHVYIKNARRLQWRMTYVELTSKLY